MYFSDDLPKQNQIIPSMTLRNGFYAVVKSIGKQPEVTDADR